MSVFIKLQIQITSVAARNTERAKEFAEKFHIKNFFGNYEELAEFDDVGKIVIFSETIE